MPQTAENFAGKEVWGLYNVNEDPTELNNVASKHPFRLAQMKALFDKEAKANQVYPLFNWPTSSSGYRTSRGRRGSCPRSRATEVGARP